MSRDQQDFIEHGWRYCRRAMELSDAVPYADRSRMFNCLSAAFTDANVLSSWRAQVVAPKLRDDLNVLLTGTIPDGYVPNWGTISLVLTTNGQLARELIARLPVPRPIEHRRILQAAIHATDPVTDPATIKLLVDLREPSECCLDTLTYEPFLAHAIGALRAKFSDKQLIKNSFTITYPRLVAAGVSFNQPTLLRKLLTKRATDYTLLRLFCEHTEVTDEMAALANAYAAGMVLFEGERAHLRPALQRMVAHAETDDCWVSAVIPADIPMLNEHALRAVSNNGLPGGRQISLLAAAELRARAL